MPGIFYALNLSAKHAGFPRLLAVATLALLANCSSRSACQMDPASEACTAVSSSAAAAAAAIEEQKTTNKTTVSTISALENVLGADGLNPELKDYRVKGIKISADMQTLNVISAPFDDNTFEAVYTRAADMDVTRGNQSLYAFVNSDVGYTNYVGFYGATAGNIVYASVVGTPDYVDFGHAGAVYGRSAATTFQSSGQVELSGAYVGQRVHSSMSGMDQITGLVKLQIDFGDNLVRGEINNRVIGVSRWPLSATYPTTSGSTGTLSSFATTVILSETALNRTAGTFAGKALSLAETGVDADGNTLSNDGAKGTYDGILGGANGNSAAGIVILNSTEGSAGGGGTRETGIFIAQK